MRTSVTSCTLMVLVLCSLGAGDGSETTRNPDLYRRMLVDEVASVSGTAYSAERAQQVLRSLEGTKRYSVAARSGAWPEIRRREAVLVGMLVANVKRQLDPAFDPKDVPSAGVAPPAGSGFSGPVDPKEIKDVGLRKEYEAMIQANAKKAEDYRRQHKLRMRYAQLTEEAKEYLTEAYALPPSRVAELKAVLEEQGWDAASILEIVNEIGARTSKKKN